MRKKILILGASGMLGSSLLKHFSKQVEYDVVGTVRNAESFLYLKKLGFENLKPGIEVQDLNSIELLVKDFTPDYIFNCIGLIKQDKKSESPTKAISINSLLPHQLAEIASLYNSKLIHFSTDCVFSGAVGNYNENDIEEGRDLYGRTKLLGEVTSDNHLTIRTSIIGHEIGSQISLIDWFLSQKGIVQGYKNAIFSGLPTCYIAEVIDEYILKKNDAIHGLYHLSALPIDKHSLLNLIKKKYSKNIIIEENDEVIINRSLNSNKFQLETGFKPLEWEILVERMHVSYLDTYEH